MKKHFTCPDGHVLFAKVEVEHSLIQSNRAWTVSGSCSQLKVYCSEESCAQTLSEDLRNAVWRAVYHDGLML